LAQWVILDEAFTRFENAKITDAATIARIGDWCEMKMKGNGSYAPVRIDNIHTCGELDVAWFDRKEREWHYRAGIKPEECRTLGSKPYLLLDAKLKIARDAGIIHRRDPAQCGGGVDAVGLYYREWKRAVTAHRAASTPTMLRRRPRRRRRRRLEIAV
jgi:hypothetical protein